MMTIKHFRAVVTHDHGTIILHLAATSKSEAIRQIETAEGCPPSAIVSIRTERKPRPKKKPKRLWNAGSFRRKG